MDSGERPLIAIPGGLSAEESPSVVLRTRYAAAVERAGGLPLVLTPLAGDAFIDGILTAVDGLFFPGGDDFDTERLGLGPTHPEANPVPAEKQDFDVALARAALERAVPTLGVCYGMQVLALAEGAGLHQHLPDDRPGSRDHTGGVRHDVAINAGTKLAALLGVPRVSVISRHHQAISTPGTRWIVSAQDDEGSIEALERENHPFALGVQWHPELAAGEAVHERLFHGFVRAAAEHRERRRLTMGAHGS